MTLMLVLLSCVALLTIAGVGITFVEEPWRRPFMRPRDKLLAVEDALEEATRHYAKWGATMTRSDERRIKSRISELRFIRADLHRKIYGEESMYSLYGNTTKGEIQDDA